MCLRIEQSSLAHLNAPVDPSPVLLDIIGEVDFLGQKHRICWASPLRLNIHFLGFPCCLSDFKFCLIVQFSTSVRGGDDCVTMSGNLLLNDDSSLLLNSVIVNSNT